MTWRELDNRDSVLNALQEFDRVGRDEFLRKYGFGKSARFMLEHNGRQYDAKAVIAAAHGYQFPAKGPLRTADFPSSAPAVKGTLERLGFTVTTKGEVA
jgi:5-methylcytosine-specific restriction protein A